MEVPSDRECPYGAVFENHECISQEGSGQELWEKKDCFTVSDMIDQKQRYIVALIILSSWILAAGNFLTLTISLTIMMTTGLSCMFILSYTNLAMSRKPRKQSVEQQGDEGIHSSIYKWKDPDVSVTTAYELFRRGLDHSVDGECLGIRPAESSEYKWMSYTEVIEYAHCLGHSIKLIMEDHSDNTNVGIYCSTRPEWYLSSLALVTQSIPIVPIYDTFGKDSVVQVLQETKPMIVICENVSKLRRLIETKKILRKLPKVAILIEFDDAELHSIHSHLNECDITLYSYGSLIVQKNKTNAQRGLHLPSPQDIYIICYTSSSTGSPKGVTITHHNFITAVKQTLMMLQEQKILSPSYTRLIAYLPMAHVYEQINQAVALFLGFKIGFYSGQVSRLLDDMKALKPHIFPAVPRVLNRIYDSVIAEVQHSIWKRVLFWSAVWWKTAEQRMGIYIRNGLIDALIFRKVRNAMGGCVSICISASAPINREVLLACRAMFGCYLLEGYGQTESTGPITLTLANDRTSGHVGALLAGVEVKLIDIPEMEYKASEGKGEICIRGETVTTGYYNHAGKAAQFVDSNGWLRTEDVGQWLPNGALKIIDRRKHILKLNQGEYVFPEKIENVYARSSLISQIYVDGDSHESYLVAVVVPNQSQLLSLASNLGIGLSKERKPSATEIEEICNNEKLKTHILSELGAVGKSHGLNSLEQVKKVHLTTKAFTIENGLLTPTLKNRRRNLRQSYEAVIASMYDR